MFSFISSSKTQSKPSGLQLVSNSMHHKRVVACKQQEEEETDANEFAMADATFIALNYLEESFEHLSRCLIKTRVSLLNILNH
ncbi:hypothetical protein PRUPE_4G275300 [Prunus persica]|uniref:Uncharacterized protein n=1 Tax=Prunus persica TaxID=3760 RepID=M5WKN9_PRUPE|nr:hypothetical protein PRUPE_4G275300 [Prunus persica]